MGFGFGTHKTVCLKTCFMEMICEHIILISPKKCCSEAILVLSQLGYIWQSPNKN